MSGSSRATQYGKIPMRQHMEESNREISLAVMIEDLPALDEIDGHRGGAGIDIVAIGPSDLAAALGVAAESDHPKVAAAIEKVRSALARGAGAGWRCR